MAKIMQPGQVKGGTTCRETIETNGEVLADGTMLELVRLNSGAGEASLLWWDGNRAIIGPQIEVNQKIYQAHQSNSTFVRSLRLPAGIAHYESTRDLFQDICKLLSKYVDVAEAYIRQIAYFTLGSWLADRLLVAPFLSIIAPLGTPRAQLLRVLTCICRRPLMLAELNAATISSLSSLGPTFLFDEPILNRRAERLLYATNAHGRCLLINDRIVDLFSSKVICTREPLSDASIAGQALQITLAPADYQVPFLENIDCERIADEFQSKLLQYRLRNHGRIRTTSMDVSDLAGPMQDVARAFGTCVADDEDLLLGVVQLLRERNQDLQFDTSAELGTVVLEGLLFCCHNKGRSQVFSGELADIVNTIWANRGEGRETTPESVGWKLRALGLRTEPIDGAGKGLRLTEAVRARIHSLALAYKVPSLRQAAQEACPHCKVGFEKK